MFTDIKNVSGNEARKLKAYYAKRWIDPIKRIEDVFNVRRADGSLTKLTVPLPQQKMIRDGILGKSQDLVGTGVSYVSVTNKGRQLGFSVILAAEAILIAEDFPGTEIHYVATTSEQAKDWMVKLEQLASDANYWPEELGGGPILNLKNIEKVFEKNINGTIITGLSANPAGIRGKTSIHVVFDEAAWAIRIKGQAKETWKALKYFIRQGGSARIQSTPRLSDDEEFFWGMYKKGESGSLAIHTYYCPVITNWEELDLQEPLWIDLNNTRRKKLGLKPIEQKDYDILVERYTAMPNFEVVLGEYIKQPAEIPYWWVSIVDLETDRATDLEQFKQENLGIPLDETYKLIKTEWIYNNLNEGDEFDRRPDGNINRFFVLIDLAQINDITAITVVEEIVQKDDRPVYIERKIVETQAAYPVQRDIIFDIYMAFRPHTISIDYTGHGIPVCEFVEEKLQNNGFNPSIVKRVTFTSQSKEEMAVGFRNIVMPDPLSEKGRSRYRWLYKKKRHEDAIRHCMRVEKVILQSSIRYSGKMHGRDDHFWSKAQIALIEKPRKSPKAAVGKYRRSTPVTDFIHKKSYGRQYIEEMNRNRTLLTDVDIELAGEVNKIRFEKVRHGKNLKFATQCLIKGIMTCRTQYKLVKPVHCAWPANCNDEKCPSHKYVQEITKRYGVTTNEVWKQQSVYEKE